MNLFERYLLEKNYTDKRAAQELGVTLMTVHQWKKGRTKPYARNAIQINKWSKGKIPSDYWENKKEKRKER